MAFALSFLCFTRAALLHVSCSCAPHVVFYGDRSGLLFLFRFCLLTIPSLRSTFSRGSLPHVPIRFGISLSLLLRHSHAVPVLLSLAQARAVRPSPADLSLSLFSPFQRTFFITFISFFFAFISLLADTECPSTHAAAPAQSFFSSLVATAAVSLVGGVGYTDLDFFPPGTPLICLDASSFRNANPSVLYCTLRSSLLLFLAALPLVAIWHTFALPSPLFLGPLLFPPVVSFR